jgi:hypothetical protein
VWSGGRVVQGPVVVDVSREEPSNPSLSGWVVFGWRVD